MADGGVHNLGSSEDFQKALEEAGPSLVVVDFFAHWCGPCKVIAPQVVEFAKEFTQAHFYKLDVDEVGEVAQEQSVRAMPSFLLFKNQQKVAEVVGAKAADLKKAIEQNV